MPSKETLERFVKLVEENAHVEACQEFYTENSSMRENQGLPRIGRENHVANERRVMARSRSISSRCIRPVLVAGDTVVIRWIFHFEFLDGTSMHVDELAYQRWEGERIADETFFYDPAQKTNAAPLQGENP